MRFISAVAILGLAWLGCAANCWAQQDENEKLEGFREGIAAQARALVALRSATSLHCRFGPGHSAKWVRGEPRTEPGEFTSTGDPIIFYGIDLEAGSAKIMGNQGTQSLAVISTLSGLTFLESTDTGNINLTTVFAGFAGQPDQFTAVHSRHFYMAGRAMPSQYHGTCVVTD